MKKIIFGLILITAFGIGSCDKKSTLPDRFTPIPAGNTNVKFLNMSPDAPQVNFFTNGIKVSAVAPTATNAVQGIAYAATYPSTVAYATMTSGSLKIEVKVPDSSAVMPGATIFTNTQTFAAGKFYTYALVDSLSKINVVTFEDDPTVPDQTKSYLRIANFIPNGTIRIEITKTSTGSYPYSITYPTIASKAVTAFDTIGGPFSYKVLLRDASTNAALDSGTLTTAAAKKATIYARGVIGQTGSTNTRRPLIGIYNNF